MSLLICMVQHIQRSITADIQTRNRTAHLNDALSASRQRFAQLLFTNLAFKHLHILVSWLFMLHFQGEKTDQPVARINPV